MLKLLILSIPLILVGCATHQVTQTAAILERVGHVPEINSEATAVVGGTLFSQFRYWSKTGKQITQPVSIGLALGRVSVSSGEFVLPSVANGKSVFCTERRTYMDPLTGPLKPTCFFDASGSGKFTHVTAAPGAIWFEKALDPPVAFTSTEQVIQKTDAFRYELLLQGASNKTLRLAYREFLNDMARPAFFQDATYDLDKFPMVVPFRNVRIEILEASNAGVKYRVLSGF